MTWGKINVKGSDRQATVWESNGVKRIEWQPGNGTRHQIIIMELSPNLEVPGMPPDGGFLVVEGPTPRAEHVGYFNREGFLSHHYVKEKMGYRSEEDAIEVTKIIATVTCRDCDF